MAEFEYKITETVHIIREFLIEAETEDQAIGKFDHKTADLINEKENRYYEVEKIDEMPIKMYTSNDSR
jgi:hypothetical protein